MGRAAKGEFSPGGDSERANKSRVHKVSTDKVQRVTVLAQARGEVVLSSVHWQQQCALSLTSPVSLLALASIAWRSADHAAVSASPRLSADAIKASIQTNHEAGSETRHAGPDRDLDPCLDRSSGSLVVCGS